MWVLAQPGPLTAGPPPPGLPPSPPGLRDVASAAQTQAALAAAQALYPSVGAVAIFEHVLGREGEKQEIKVLLGDTTAIYGRFNLDPKTKLPVPLGLEGFASAPTQRDDLEALFQVATHLIPDLSLSNLVVKERDGYKLLLIYEGQLVGELKLNEAYAPRTDEKWLEEFGESAWRYPEQITTQQSTN